MALSRVSILSLSTLSLAACTGGDKADTGAEDTGEVAVSKGMPEGSSTWSGSGEVGGLEFPLEVELVNTNGDLSGTVRISDNESTPIGLGEGAYTIVGSHAAASGSMAVAPVEWTEDPDLEIELIGATGTYDIDSGTLSGSLRDWASGSDNTLQGGPFSLSLVSGDGEPTPLGEGAMGLEEGEQSFSGTMKCTGDEREVAGSITHDGLGGVTGSLILGNNTVSAPLGTFDFDGTHNPETGSITVAPQVWDDPAPSTLTFMVSGPYDPAEETWTGDLLTNTAACPSDTWDTVVGAR